MNIKKLTLFVSLFSLLLLGQGSAATVASVSVNSFNDGAAYSLDLWWVGTDTANMLTPSTYGTYDIVSTTGLVSLTIKVNITGFAMWNDIYNITGVPDAPTSTVGQLDVIIDGHHATRAAGYTGGSGIQVTLAGLGDHTVSYLYSNMDEDGTYHYATDSITIRLRSTNTFAAYKTGAFPLVYTVTDSATAGQNISRQNMALLFNYAYGIYTFTKNTSLTAGNDAVIGVDNTGTKITMSGAIDSTGSIDDALNQWVTSTAGRVFIVDAAGLHLYDGTAFDVTLRTEDALTSTFVGLFVLADAGMFYDDYDYEEFYGTVNDTGTPTDFDFSFDFLGNVEGSTLGIDLVPGTFTTSVTSVATSTSTVEGPGFSGFDALLGLLSLGTIAFLIPRKFRK
ncbi:MAG: hypothetical protein GPJ54_13955 [Candidatus Heimdallarchaeota archaeon]|nr:hypothetical protein [Candidatus Heimdallarchaeota archaeon]